MNRKQDMGFTKQVKADIKSKSPFIPIELSRGNVQFDDLRPFDSRVVDARVVGIGVSERFTHELILLQGRLLRWLVEDHGFRLLVLEEDWTKGIELDQWICQGNEDASVALEGAWRVWRTKEIAETLDWLRERNRQHPDDLVHIAGLDFTKPRKFAYDAVVAFARTHLPNHANEIASAYEDIQNAHDKVKTATLARHVVDLLESQFALELPVFHARLIHAYHSLEASEVVDTEALFADNVQWWLNAYDRKAVIWGGLAHTAAAPSTAWNKDTLKWSYGSHLRARLGGGYSSVGLMFNKGRTLFTYPPPPTDFVELLFTVTEHPSVVTLDVAKAAQSKHTALGQWVSKGATTRVVGPKFTATQNQEFSMSGASLRDWFDILVHVQNVTPAFFLKEDVLHK